MHICTCAQIQINIHIHLHALKSLGCGGPKASCTEKLKLVLYNICPRDVTVNGDDLIVVLEGPQGDVQTSNTLLFDASECDGLKALCSQR